MKIKEFKQHFNNQLKDVYPKDELKNLFNLLQTHITGLSRMELALYPEICLSDQQINAFQKGVERLKDNEPLQYIIGETEFYGLRFKVNQNVLIPRSETEELVAKIVEENQGHKVALSILDIGTGSGCIAISLASELPQATVTAYDVSKGALEVARENAKLNHLNVNFEWVNILNQQVETVQKFKIIVSNPPYIPHREKKLMKANVLDYEPHVALFVEDHDPLLFYRKITQFAQRHLEEDGSLWFEINEFLKEELTQMLHQSKVKDFKFYNDFFGKPRILRIRF